MDTIKLPILGRIALGVAVVGTGSLYAIRWTIQSKIRESPTYGEALKCLRENKNAVDVLGEPIKEKGVDIGDRDCYGRKDNVCWVTVPLEGRRRKGSLHYWIDTADQEGTNFRLTKVELSIDRSSVGRILLRDDPADSNIKAPVAK